MTTIKNLIELKRNVNDFDKWFVDNPTEIPTLKVFYEKLGVDRRMVKKIKKVLAEFEQKDIIDMSIDNSIDMSMDMSIDKTKVIEENNNKLLSLNENKQVNANCIYSSYKQVKCIYDILLECSDKLQYEFWHRAINSERKYLNPRLIEMYYQNFIEKKDKQSDMLNINIKIAPTEVSIKKK